MDPSDAEECHSSESGWTKYLGSNINDSGYREDGHNSDYGGVRSQPENGVSDDDDSMASDASSGPSHRGQKKYDGDDEKKANKTQEKKRMDRKKKVEKKGVVIDNSKGKTQVQDGGKVRNFFSMGKKK